MDGVLMKLDIGDKGKKRKHYEGRSVSWVTDPPIVSNKGELA